MRARLGKVLLRVVVLLGLLGRRLCSGGRDRDVDADEAPWLVESQGQTRWSEARESTALL